MKQLFFSLLIATSLVALFSASCQKASDPSPNPAPGAVAGLLQGKWIVVSLDVFANRGFVGPMYPGLPGNGTDYYNFTSDGKLNVVAFGTTGTGNYKLLTDDSTLYVYNIVNGVTATKPDTAYIRTISSSQLIIASRNPVNEWGRFVFKR